MSFFLLTKQLLIKYRDFFRIKLDTDQLQLINIIMNIVSMRTMASVSFIQFISRLKKTHKDE
jgi:hypothetical protein